MSHLDTNGPEQRRGHAVPVGLHDDGRLAGARRRHQERGAGGAARRHRHVHAAEQLDFWIICINYYYLVILSEFTRQSNE